MSSGPKASDYKPTEAEKMNAAVAQAEYNRFKQLYDPLLQQMRDESMTGNFAEIARGKANADTMQALTQQQNYQNTQRVGYQGDLASALGGQLGQADTQAKGAQNAMQLSVLGTARGQQADGQKAMSQLARIKSSEAIERAKANQAVATAKFNAAAKIGLAAGMQGWDNMQTKGMKMAGDGYGPPQEVSGSFFTPVDENGNKISGFGARYDWNFGG